jgi:hypothetical protein
MKNAGKSGALETQMVRSKSIEQRCNTEVALSTELQWDGSPRCQAVCGRERKGKERFRNDGREEGVLVVSVATRGRDRQGFHAATREVRKSAGEKIAWLRFTKDTEAGTVGKGAGAGVGREMDRGAKIA